MKYHLVILTPNPTVFLAINDDDDDDDRMIIVTFIYFSKGNC